MIKYAFVNICTGNNIWAISVRGDNSISCVILCILYNLFSICTIN